jgi:hypothetical protein
MVVMKAWSNMSQGHELGSNGNWKKAWELIQNSERAIDNYSKNENSILIYQGLEEEKNVVI